MGKNLYLYVYFYSLLNFLRGSVGVVRMKWSVDPVRWTGPRTGGQCFRVRSEISYSKSNYLSQGHTSHVQEGCHTKRVSAAEQFPRFVAGLVISVLYKDLKLNLASTVSMASIISWHLPAQFRKAESLFSLLIFFVNFCKLITMKCLRTS